MNEPFVVAIVPFAFFISYPPTASLVVLLCIGSGRLSTCVYWITVPQLRRSICLCTLLSISSAVASILPDTLARGFSSHNPGLSPTCLTANCTRVQWARVAFQVTIHKKLFTATPLKSPTLLWVTCAHLTGMESNQESQLVAGAHNQSKSPTETVGGTPINRLIAQLFVSAHIPQARAAPPCPPSS